MNLEKDKSINKLLNDLQIKQHGWIIVDHWESDRNAIGIATKDAPRCLVYISTFKKEAGLFDCECEVPIGEDITEFTTTEKKENINFDELLLTIKNHFVKKV